MGPLSGDVEVDETSWGGKPRRKLRGYSVVGQFENAAHAALISR